MTTQQPAQLVCQNCQQPLRGRFRIERYNAQGTMTIAANVCSVACLVRWAANYAQLAGQQGLAQARGLVDSVVDFFKGGR